MAKQLNKDSSNVNLDEETCSYSGLPSPKAYGDFDDEDVMEFLNDPANNKEPNEMGDTHEYIKGGLTYDKGEGFKAFQAKQNQTTEWVDRDESEYDSSSDGSGEANGGEANDGEEANDANEY
tara:strand:- start:1498 stop:1863 length:366 start_codon:yes stop_codon:yes gene_type:complete